MPESMPTKITIKQWPPKTKPSKKKFESKEKQMGKSLIDCLQCYYNN